MAVPERKVKYMAQLTAAAFLGTTLAAAIAGNEAAIEGELGLNAGAIAADEERLIQAILINLRTVLIADGTNDPSISVQSPGAATPWTRSYSSARPGEVGYTLSIQLWQSDGNPADPDGDNAA